MQLVLNTPRFFKRGSFFKCILINIDMKSKSYIAILPVH